MPQREELHVIVGRLIKLLTLLSSNVGYRIGYLVENIGVTERTIYRYLSSLKNAGLLIELKNGYYRIEKNSSHHKDFSKLLHFSQEESVILLNSIHNIEPDSLTKQNLKEKLYALYNSDRINYPIVNKADAGNVKIILEAINNRKFIRLINYKSSNTGQITDREVEPFGFTTNYIHLWAYEPKSEKNLMFRISRIEKVVQTDKNWAFEKLHKEGKTDVFRMNGVTENKVLLKLTLKGKNYLVEQYPLAQPFIEKICDNEYYFNGWYANFEGISKFIFSAIDDVEVVKPQELKDHLNRKIEKKVF